MPTSGRGLGDLVKPDVSYLGCRAETKLRGTGSHTASCRIWPGNHVFQNNSMAWERGDWKVENRWSGRKASSESSEEAQKAPGSPLILALTTMTRATNRLLYILQQRLVKVWVFETSGTHP